MSIRQVAPAEAHELVCSGWRYIDVRTEREFAAGHPVDAVNVPILIQGPAGGPMAPNPEFLGVVQRHFAKEARLVIGCQSGMRSQKAADLLSQAGYQNLCNMQGGFGGLRDRSGGTVHAGWAESDLPICRDCPELHRYATLKGGA
jgi:rhodanese-related sulfurtransferase